MDANGMASAPRILICGFSALSLLQIMIWVQLNHGNATIACSDLKTLQYF